MALGANLPTGARETPRQSCERALRAIARIDGVADLTRSGWYSSAPVPPSDQPRYVNGVVRLRSVLAPEMLLAALQAIEQTQGRVRERPNAARTLDLDIIDMAGQIRAAPDPILPHPRAHLRGFVLRPLRDVAPCWSHPVSGQTIGNLIAALPPEDITRL